jgi:hypothetical protein
LSTLRCCCCCSAAAAAAGDLTGIFAVSALTSWVGRQGS